MKRIIVLMMIVFLFSISACSENVVSSDPAESTVTSSENVSAEENTSTDSSQSESVVSSQTKSSSEMNTLSQNNSSSLNQSSVYENSSSTSSFVPQKTGPSDGILIVCLTEEATEKYTDLSAGFLSKEFGIEIISVTNGGLIRNFDDVTFAPKDGEVRIMHIHVPKENRIEEVQSILQQHESVKLAALSYQMDSWY